MVVIDEVQKAPELLSVVHSLIEERCGHALVLTGSSSRKLKHAGVDMLAGRALLRTMHPFMAGELGEAFDLDTALRQGMLPRDLDFYYWRTRSGSEIDFVLYGSDGFHAIEVKNSARLRPADLTPLRTFGQDYPECTPLFLYRGEAPMMVDGIRCLHVDDFLRRLHPERPFPK